MEAIKVLVVDDSAVVRRLLSDTLSAEEGIRVLAAVDSASAALARLDIEEPDVVTLDVEMPGVSGLELLEKIRRRLPRLPIIMFSSLTMRAGATTLEALARGATDYVTKPTGVTSRAEAIERVRRDLVPKVRAFGRRHSALGTAISRSAMPAVKLAAPKVTTRASEVLAVGCSTGGPNALAAVFGVLPAAFAVPVVIVQHMPPIFTKLLADRLTALGGMVVKEAEDGDELVPGRALLAPGDFHMRVVRRGTRCVVTLDQSAPVNSCRPAVDHLFESVANVFDARALGVIMTGMGRDGLRGATHIREKGGQIIAQDEATSVVWGMPGFVAKADLANAVLPLGSIAADILSRIRTTRRNDAASAGVADVR